MSAIVQVGRQALRLRARQTLKQDLGKITQVHAAV